jgi:flagellar biosynthetic protein FliP
MNIDYFQLADQFAKSEALDQLAPPLRIALFLGALSLASMALVTMTAFTRIVIVLSFVRRALSTQEIPPNPVILGLSMFLTVFVMGPTLDRVTAQAVQPYLAGEISGHQAVVSGVAEFHRFMITHTRRADLGLMFHLASVTPPATPEETPLRVLIPAFVLSEIKTAFIMGFCIYVPFLLIDLVVSTVLMSLGMMMMPPMIMSLPLKILLFVLVDGWQLVVRSLGASFG